MFPALFESILFHLLKTSKEGRWLKWIIEITSLWDTFTELKEIHVAKQESEVLWVNFVTQTHMLLS